MAVDSFGATLFESSLEEPVSTPAPGKLGGLRRGASISRYLLLERVGAGGMGVVWAAYDPELDRRVAIKLLRPRRGQGSSEQARARLIREAQAMARISHPNVIPVHDVGEHGGRVFVAMEFVDGQTLGEWVRARSERGDWQTIIAMFAQAGRGLAAAHAAGLVHRDFKPDNVLVGDDGRARVTDFGLARSVDVEDFSAANEQPAPRSSARASLGPNAHTGTDEHIDDDTLAPPEQLELVETSEADPRAARVLHTPLTRTGMMLGTPAYMAPEQFASGRFDALSDQFSFCVALWEALFGVRPFAGRTLTELSAAVTEGRIQPGPEDCCVPSFVERALRRGLSVAPTKRWPDLEALLEVLEHDPNINRRRRRLVLAGALTLGAAALLAVVPGLSARNQAVETPVLCPDADERLTGVWDQSRREALHAGHTDGDLDEAAASAEDHHTARWIESELDAYAQRWLAMHKDACEDTHVRNEQSEDMLDKRMQCLEERREALAATVELIVDSGDMGDSFTALAGLPSVERCDDRDYLEAQQPIPDDLALAARVAALRAELAPLRARVDIGRGVGALDELASLVERTEALGYAPLHAQALAEYAFASAVESEPSESRDRLQRAIVASIETGQDELAARAATEMIFVQGWKLQNVSAGLGWVGLVEAWNARINAPAPARASAKVSESLVRIVAGEDGEEQLYAALAMLGVDESFAQIGSLDATAAHPAGIALNVLSIANSYRGEFEAAKRTNAALIELRTRFFGADDPSVATFTSHRAAADFWLGNWAEAARVDAELLAEFDSLDDPKEIGPLLVASHALQHQLALSALLAEPPPCGETIELLADELAATPSSPIHPRATVVLATARRRCGALDAAASLLAQVEVSDHAYAPQNPMLWLERGAQHLARGRTAEARADFEQLIAHAETLDDEGLHPDIALARHGLGELALVGGDSEAARAQFEAALTIWDHRRPDGHPFAHATLSRLAELAPSDAEAQSYRARAEGIRERVRRELGGA
ncbi:protein kinase [Pseudenhygromyxa sp. WMMC2535]|uniref:serine/threonine-protein kinase n=1 Tax=Pseudenhygromyxa sp. WMMC2535 TaxID=2712867 RepID=UPI0015571C69|nr:serine/threonine-protein kinase [Pseudenhygromyxa sp. WMMC2535]NVB39031.1 protein kinase [Pseudenhygromyxa sp. WMMC2535]